MGVAGTIRNAIESCLPPHAEAFADKIAWKSDEEGEALLEFACGALRADLGSRLPKTLAIEITAAFAAMVREDVLVAKALAA